MRTSMTWRRKRLIMVILTLLAGVILVFVNRERIIYTLSPQAKVNPSSLQSGQYDPTCTTAICDNKPITIPAPPPSNSSLLLSVTPSQQPKRIEVDLTNQRLYAYEGTTKVYDFLISSGKWGRTPTGTFHIWIKLRYARMTGGSHVLGTYYDLPNVPFTMYFYNDTYAKSEGFAIHGTYWHHNFGHPMSHGCINMETAQAEIIYNWAAPDLMDKTNILASPSNPETEVDIYGTAPNT